MYAPGSDSNENEYIVMNHRLPQRPYNQDIPVYDLLEEYDLDTELGLVGCLYD